MNNHGAEFFLEQVNSFSCEKGKQFQKTMNYVRVLQVMGMIPGFREDFMTPGSEEESMARLKRLMTMMDR